jgi:ubiquinone/menaquinone biosynthesis C-methylase UbiE
VDLDERAGPKYHSAFWLASAERLPFADGQFDFVCTEYMLEHAQDPGAIFREAYRVLAPGGTILLVTPNLWSYKYLVAASTPFSFHLECGNDDVALVSDEWHCSSCGNSYEVEGNVVRVASSARESSTD